MRPRLLAALSLGALVTAAACLRAPPSFRGPFAYESAPPPAACGPLPLLTDISGWTVVPVFTGQMTVRLPPEFAHDTTVRFFHSGRLWRHGPVSFEETGGHWDYNSFRPFRSSRPPRRYTECEARVGRFTVLIVEREEGNRLKVGAWVRDTTRVVPMPDGRAYRFTPATTLIAEGPRRTAALVRTIVRSLR